MGSYCVHWSWFVMFRCFDIIYFYYLSSLNNKKLVRKLSIKMLFLTLFCAHIRYTACNTEAKLTTLFRMPYEKMNMYFWIALLFLHSNFSGLVSYTLIKIIKLRVKSQIIATYHEDARLLWKVVYIFVWKSSILQ